MIIVITNKATIKAPPPTITMIHGLLEEVEEGEGEEEEEIEGEGEEEEIEREGEE